LLITRTGAEASKYHPPLACPASDIGEDTAEFTLGVAMLIMPPAVESESVLVALGDPLFMESDGALVETGVDVEVSGVV
jgi:hypothetical protein